MNSKESIDWEIVNDTLIPVNNNYFWLYSYSKRHLFFREYAKTSFENTFDELNNYLSTFQSYIYKFYDPLLLWSGINIERDMIAILSLFHNKKYKYKMEHIFIPHFLNANNINNFYEFLLESMPREVTKALSKIDDISYKYGFFLWDFTLPDNWLFELPDNWDSEFPENVEQFFYVDDFLKESIIKKNKFIAPRINYFIKNGTRNKNDSIITESLNGKQFKVSKHSEHNLLIYINPDDTHLSFNKIERELEDFKIGKKKINSIGDKNTAKLLFRVNVNSSAYSKHDLLKTIQYEIDGYRTFFNQLYFHSPISVLTILPIDVQNDDPSFVKIKKKHNAKTKRNLELFKKSAIGPYEQENSISRAIGLWLWDRIHSYEERMNLSAAMKEIQKMDLPSEYKIPQNNITEVNIDTIKRRLRRDYELACKCIEAFDVLPLSKKQK